MRNRPRSRDRFCLSVTSPMTFSVIREMETSPHLYKQLDRLPRNTDTLSADTISEGEPHWRSFTRLRGHRCVKEGREGLHPHPGPRSQARHVHREDLDRDDRPADISDLSARIEEAMEPFRLARELLVGIPASAPPSPRSFIAETGANVTVFRMPEQLAPWGGPSRGTDESAGRVKSAITRPGNRYLKGALGIAALSAVRSNGTYSQPNTGAYPPDADRSRHSSPANMPCSPQPGTWLPPANFTATPEPSTSPGAHPSKPGPAPSDNSKPSATRSPWNPSTRPDRTPHSQPQPGKPPGPRCPPIIFMSAVQGRLRSSRRGAGKFASQPPFACWLSCSGSDEG
jgi:hypothetical protein